jgi:glycine hydroxymethyltransferase
MTTKGFKEEEFRKVGQWIALALKHKEDEEIKKKLRKQVISLTDQYPFA